MPATPDRPHERVSGRHAGVVVRGRPSAKGPSMAAAADQPAVTLDPGGPMPLLGFGTWQMTGGRCQSAVRHALEVGYRHIDTAAMYRNERDVGRAVRDSGVPREQVFV